MEDKQLVKQLKKLGDISPNKHWVALTKKNLFEEEKTSWMYIPMGRSALVLSCLALAIVAVTGGLVLVGPQKMPITAYDNFNALIARFVSQNKSNEMAVASLEEIQDKLGEINLSLENIKKIKDPNQALTMTEVIKGTARKGGEVVERIKMANGTLSKQVLASLGEIAELSKNLEEKSDEMQREMFEAYLLALKLRSDLTEEDLENLEKAEAYYSEGKYSEAVIFIIKIGS